MEKRSDLRRDAQFLAQLPAQALFEGFVILEFAPRELPLERISGGLSPLAEEYAAGIGRRSVLEDNADRHLNHDEKIAKLGWKYNEPCGRVVPLLAVYLPTSSS
jgi:hypothetical protein